MQTQDTQKMLGMLIPQDVHAKRDAIHIAVMPSIATVVIRPGQKVFVTPSGEACLPTVLAAVGIADPYLEQTIEEGEKFFTYLFPLTTTGMRHHWTHPTLGSGEREENQWPAIRKVAEICNITFASIMEFADEHMRGIEDYYYFNLGDNEEYMNVGSGEWEQFWIEYKRYRKLPQDAMTEAGEQTGHIPFNCAC